MVVEPVAAGIDQFLIGQVANWDLRTNPTKCDGRQRYLVSLRKVQHTVDTQVLIPDWLSEASWGICGPVMNQVPNF